MSDTKPIGHNNPPDPIDEALAPYSDAIGEAENWLDGKPVENDAQMKAVDGLIASIRAAERSAKEAEASESKPLHDAWKAAKARWKPTLDDLARIKKGLSAAVEGFKRKKAAEQAEAERRARLEHERKMREAAEALAKADESDIEAQREAAAAAQAAKDAQAELRAVKSEKVTGLRTVTKHEVHNYTNLARWVWQNDPVEMKDWLNDYARRHAGSQAMDGVRVWKEKVAR